MNQTQPLVLTQDRVRLHPTERHPYPRIADRRWITIPGTKTSILVAQIVRPA